MKTFVAVMIMSFSMFFAYEYSSEQEEIRESEKQVQIDYIIDRIIETNARKARGREDFDAEGAVISQYLSLLEKHDRYDEFHMTVDAVVERMWKRLDEIDARI